MRRSLVVMMVVLASLAAAPAASAAAPVSLTVTPSVETLVVGSAYSPGATVRDAAGQPVAGVLVDWRVTSGEHAADDLDGNALTPPGVFGVCETNVSGFCAATYTGARTTTDTIRALVDADHDGVADDGEPAGTASIDWRGSGNGPSALRVDMSGCDGDVAAPIDSGTWNAAGSGVQVGSVRAVCAARFDVSDGLAPGPVTFTIIGGPGVFTDETGAADLGTQLVAQASGGLNKAWLRSTASGTTTVRASFASTVVDGTASWLAGAARTISLAGPSSAVSGTTATVTATVRDRYANPVPGIEVVFSDDGVGGFTGGVESVTATTSAAGTATAAVQTAGGQTGTQTVAASISPGSTDCELAAGDPAGASAGVCRAEVALGWVEAAPTLSLAVTPPIGVWGTDFSISGTLAAGQAGIAGKAILIYGRPVGSGPTAWEPLSVVTTDENGLYAGTHEPDRHTEYRAVFGGDDSFTSAVSGTDRADVRMGLHFNASVPLLRSGQAVVFSGRILPDHPNHPVWLQQLTPAGWRTIATTRTGATSRYQFRVVKRSPGGLLFRTITPSDFHHAWNASLNRRIDWR